MTKKIANIKLAGGAKMIFCETQAERRGLRLGLLATACAVALLSTSPTMGAEQSDGPILWLELGGQLQRLSAIQEPAGVAFVGPQNPYSGSFPDFSRPPRSGYEADAALSFQPEDSDWIFSAAVRYGRANRHAQDYAGELYYAYSAEAKSVESHQILDFVAGKDVGLGIGDSVIGIGVRFAQLHSQSELHISSLYRITYEGHADNVQQNSNDRKFRGLGPLLSWKVSTPIAGQLDTGELTFDWGANAALLFGRQTTKIHNNGVAHWEYFSNAHNTNAISTQTFDTSLAREKSVKVPDLEGFAGISYRVPNAKISVGYRIDRLFGAMDGGIATHKSSDRGFNGPFVNISVGVSPSDF